MQNVLEVLKARGFIEQATHEQELTDHTGSGPISCYIGFDPTASSLHVGHLVPIMALAHMQRHGHRPIALVGGGTGLVGDPSGKTEMRKMLSVEQVNANVADIKRQLARFLDFSEGKALMLNNADWLTQLSLIPFLRDVGRHFSVNRMIKAESCRARLESEEGLSFIEFNYMVLQAYDFYQLCQKHKCRLQMGGSDQWGNIIAGIDLIRRALGEQAFGVTFKLITTSSGAKMGKTAAGAVWLDSERTSPYEYYQFWVNTDDRDVARFLSLFTFLPLSEIWSVENLEGADLNSAKSVLAYEATKLVHGEEEALKAHRSACEMFGTRTVADAILPTSNIPRSGNDLAGDSVPFSEMGSEIFENGIAAFKLFQEAGLAKSGGEARRLIEQGGGYVNGRRIESFDEMIYLRDFNSLEMVLRAGKKRFHKIVIKEKK